ncbi:MAG TPA: glycerophosphodiester phosphodiesterase, partial [Solirubrobacter sp.]|nr:glycerophosphodiester phosphodiesterase [Solirubrobacter sp.]
RGASAHRPEHTLAAYRLAIALGADYIEPDLVATKDHVLVARHENEISSTTDAGSRPEFAARRATKVVDGREATGWFTEDFTLAELKTLRARERVPDLRPANTAFDGQYEIPTFREVLELAVSAGVGVYPETKHPTYFASLGLPLEPPLIAALRDHGLDRRDADVFVQSFEVGNLQALAERLDVRLVQLTSAGGRPYGDSRTYAELTTPAGLRQVAAYADAIGPSKNQVVPRDADGCLLAPTSLVADAHAAGLAVHPYTFRPENAFLPADFREGDDAGARGDTAAELALFYSLGVDAVFADHPDTAVAVRDGSRL